MPINEIDRRLISILSGKATEDRFLQWLNARGPSSFTPSMIVADSSASHPSNTPQSFSSATISFVKVELISAPVGKIEVDVADSIVVSFAPDGEGTSSPRMFTPPGITIERMALHSANALSFKTRSESGNANDRMSEHPLKAFLPMRTNPSGMSIASSFVQLRNDASPMFLTDAGKETSVRFVQE